MNGNQAVFGGAEDADEVDSLVDGIGTNLRIARSLIDLFHARRGNKHDSAREVASFEAICGRNLGLRHPLTLRDAFTVSKSVLVSAEDATGYGPDRR